MVEEETSKFLALGTSSGSLMVYSLSTTEVETTINSATSHSLTCLTWDKSNGIYAGAEQHVLQFDIKQKCVKR